MMSFQTNRNARTTKNTGLDGINVKKKCGTLPLWKAIFSCKMSRSSPGHVADSGSHDLTATAPEQGYRVKLDSLKYGHVGLAQLALSSRSHWCVFIIRNIDKSVDLQAYDNLSYAYIYMYVYILKPDGLCFWWFIFSVGQHLHKKVKKHETCPKMAFKFWGRWWLTMKFGGFRLIRQPQQSSTDIVIQESSTNSKLHLVASIGSGWKMDDSWSNTSHSTNKYHVCSWMITVAVTHYR